MDKRSLTTWAVLGTAALALGLVVKDPYFASVMNLVAGSVLIAASLRFVMLVGEVSFATAAFVGYGAYGAGVATTIFDWPFAIAMLFGPLIAVVVSFAFGAVTLRSKGPYFMLIGVAFTEAVRILYSRFEILGSTSGMIGIFPPMALEPYWPLFVIGVVLVLLFVLYWLEKSDFGKLLLAIQDNENVVRTVGINTLFCKIGCFAISAFCAGVAGSLHAFVNNVISPADFGFHLAAFALAYIMVGGEHSFLGSVCGAIFLVLIGSFALGLGEAEVIFYGGAIVISLLLMPRGLAGLFERGKRPGPGNRLPAILRGTGKGAQS